MNSIKLKSVHPTFIIVLTLLSVSCSKESKKEDTNDVIPVVEVTSIKSLQPSLDITLPGELKAWNKTQIFPKVKGYLNVVAVDRGTSVKKGQVLASLEAPELIASLNHTKAQVSSAEALLLERKSKQRVSKQTYSRILQTSKTKGAISDNELDIAYATMVSDSALLVASQENLASAKAQMDAQSHLAQYLTIRAPFDGTVIERNVSPGDLVGPETNIKPMFVLEDASKLRLTIAIPENLSNSIGEKNTVTFSTQAEPTTRYTASFARSANSLQESNRSMSAEYDYVNSHKELKAGMYAKVTLPIQRQKASLFVPKTSVLHSTEGIFIMKVNNNAVEWVNIQEGNSLDSLIEVFGTVHEGDKIIKKVHDELRNGHPIKVKS